jgi:predicted transcriptional regulator
MDYSIFEVGIMATKADETVHFDLVVSPSANTAIQTIANDRGLSPSDIITRAISLFLEVEKARKAGQTVGVLDSDKKPVVEFVGF